MPVLAMLGSGSQPIPGQGPDQLFRGFHGPGQLGRVRATPFDGRGQQGRGGRRQIKHADSRLSAQGLDAAELEQNGQHHGVGAIFHRDSILTVPIWPGSGLSA